MARAGSSRSLHCFVIGGRAKSGLLARAAKNRSSPESEAVRPRVGRRVPLAALRLTLNQGSATAIWSMNSDGVLGRSLLISAGTTVTVPLRLANEVWLSARAMLLPHDWRDGRGAVRASVAVTDSVGCRRELWWGALRSSTGRGAPRGKRIDCRLPESTVALHLTIDPGVHQYRAVARAIWVEPAIIDPHAPSLSVPPAATPPPSSPPTSGAPLISVLTPVHDPPLPMLHEAIGSVRSQTFSDWELCVVDDGSTDPEIIAALERHSASDPRIHLIRRDKAGGISTATNAALQLATGQYVALLDHDDTLTPDALQHVADRIAAEPDLDMIYTDEDILLDGRRLWVHLKPDWSPDTLRTNGYTCHLGVYRRTLVDEIGGFRPDFDGSQDIDMILRLVERTDRIAHIPRILYHWRAHARSTAGGDAKPYAYVAARAAIADHVERTGLEAEVGYGPPGLYRLAHRVDPSTSIDIVLAVDGVRGLAEAASSWQAQPHPAWRVVLAAPARVLSDAANLLTAAGLPRARITPILSPDGDMTGALAAAAQSGTAEHLLLMQTPAVAVTYDWLTRLIGYSRQSQIGAAGPILIAPDGRIQQAGIAVPEGIPLHLLHGARSSMDNHFGYGTSVYNVSAVSGMLATRRDTYLQLGGLDPKFKELALIEYCLRATDRDMRIVIVPDARLRATGPDRTTNDLPTIWQLRRAWAQRHTHDPYYNPNYRTDRGDFEPRHIS